MTKPYTLLGVSLLSLLVGLRAQSPTQPSDMTVDAAMRSEVIDGALKALVAGYVFPDVAEQMAQSIRMREQRKEYAGITSARQLAQTLTDHLRAVSKDRHLAVNYSPQVLTPQPPPAQATGRPPTSRHNSSECGRSGCARILDSFESSGWLAMSATSIFESSRRRQSPGRPPRQR